MKTFGRILIAGVVLGVFVQMWMHAPTAEAQTSVLTFAFVAFLYMAPWFVALRRGHHNTAAIGMLSLLLGWTFIGWAIAMIWACTAVQTKHGELPSRSPAVAQ